MTRCGASRGVPTRTPESVWYSSPLPPCRWPDRRERVESSSSVGLAGRPVKRDIPLPRLEWSAQNHDTGARQLVAGDGDGRARAPCAGYRLETRTGRWTVGVPVLGVPAPVVMTMTTERGNLRGLPAVVAAVLAERSALGDEALTRGMGALGGCGHKTPNKERRASLGSRRGEPSFYARPQDMAD